MVQHHAEVWFLDARRTLRAAEGMSGEAVSYMQSYAAMQLCGHEVVMWARSVHAGGLTRGNIGPCVSQQGLAYFTLLGRI